MPAAKIPPGNLSLLIQLSTSRQSGDLAEVQMLNVVEELAVAVAVGIPAPPVYVLDDERCLNAFAAGHSVEDAVLRVTRGALRTLTRSELQAIVAHEFSHILAGDMRVNLRMLCWLAGLEAVSRFGENIGDPSGDAYAFIPAIILSALLRFFGYGGIVSSRMVRRAVNRQCEFLADAKAVELTRNPQAMADALRKVGGGKYGSQLRHGLAGAISHLPFAQGAYGDNLHPNLAQRIRRLLPHWDGTYLKAVFSDPDPEAAYMDFLKAPEKSALSTPPLRHAPLTTEEPPLALRHAALTNHGAAAVLLAPLLQSFGFVRMGLADIIPQEVAAEFERLRPHCSGLSIPVLLAAIDQALITLRRRSASDRQSLIRQVDTLIEAAGELTPECAWRSLMLQTLVRRHLQRNPTPRRKTPLSARREEAAQVLRLATSSCGAEASRRFADAVAECRYGLAAPSPSLHLLPPRRSVRLWNAFPIWTATPRHCWCAPASN